jgi:hypothetical protein
MDEMSCKVAVAKRAQQKTPGFLIQPTQLSQSMQLFIPKYKDIPAYCTSFYPINATYFTILFAKSEISLIRNS